MGGGKYVYLLKKGSVRLMRIVDVAEGEIVEGHVRVDLFGNAECPKSFDLGGKDQGLILPGVVKRFFTEAVAGGEDVRAVGERGAEERAAVHPRRSGEGGVGEGGGCEIDEADETRFDAAGGGAGAADEERDVNAFDGEPLFAPRHGAAVISEEKHERVIKHTGFGELGEDYADALIDAIRPITEQVAAIYDRMVDAGGSEGPRMADEGLPLEEQLTDLGYTDPAAIMQRMARWRSGKIRAIRSASARDAFEAVLPAIMKALALAPDSDRAIARFENMIEAIPSAINVFRLLEARPGLLQLVANILSYAPTLADDLARQSRYLDALIDTSAMNLPGDMAALHDAMARRIGDADYQSMLDIVRDYVGEKRFALGVQLIEGRSDASDIARSYAHLAEAALQTLTAATVAEFEKAHGRIDGSELVILALGRLGGEALTHASDLDLILLFTGNHLAESNGPRALGATQYFNRLAQRVIAAMSVPTASGALYEVDTRLRPSGADGLLCASVKSFDQYQRENAWTWEHMALTRARVLFGSADARAQVGTIVADVLHGQRDPEKLRADIASMRKDMAAHKPPKGELDVKLLPGGLVDMEFIIHRLQLETHAALVPQLDPAIDALIRFAPPDVPRWLSPGET